MVFKGAIKESGKGAVRKSTERKHRSRDSKGVTKNTRNFPFDLHLQLHPTVLNGSYLYCQIIDLCLSKDSKCLMCRIISLIELCFLLLIFFLHFFFLNEPILRYRIICLTGKSLSEALIFASTNPQYNDRLLIELQVQYMKIPSLNLGRTCCAQKLFLTFRTIFVLNMFSP